MRLLLDTHVALWAIFDDARLPQPAADLIADPRHLIVVSAASVWEIAIKYGLARGRANDMPVSASDALAYFRAAGYELLAVTADHAAAVAALPEWKRVVAPRSSVPMFLSRACLAMQLTCAAQPRAVRHIR